jgi:biotin synthase
MTKEEGDKTHKQTRWTSPRKGEVGEQREPGGDGATPQRSRVSMDPHPTTLPSLREIKLVDLPLGEGIPSSSLGIRHSPAQESLGVVRHDWTRAQVRALFALPFPELMFHAQSVHRLCFDPCEVQISTLLSIKTGGCPEDCAYCPQSARYDTGVKAEKLLPLATVAAEARAAKDAGASRFCMGAAWREPKDRDLDKVCEMVEVVKALGLETCATLGMLTRVQALRLKDSGLDYYNHNLDTSPDYYGAIITTRTYRDRLDTLEHVRAAGIHVCCGGIIGMGEDVEDRVGLIATLANLPAHPESVPINMLVKVAGTPLAHERAIDPIELVRTIAVARITLPRSVVRLSAGREDMSEETQALCFLAGANSIFYGPKLLTTPNPERDRDLRLLDKLGLTPMEKT